MSFRNFSFREQFSLVLEVIGGGTHFTTLEVPLEQTIQFRRKCYEKPRYHFLRPIHRYPTRMTWMKKMFLKFSSKYGELPKYIYFFLFLCENLNAIHRIHLLTKFQQYSSYSFRISGCDTRTGKQQT